MLLSLALALATAGSAPLGTVDARHLLARTGFGPTRAEIEKTAALSKAEAVEQVLSSLQPAAQTKPPDFVPLLPKSPDMDKADKRAIRIREAVALKEWWAQEMLTTSSPFTERLTLFWANHFTSSVQKVKAPELLYQQNVMLRREAAGNFGTLLRDVVDDRAMLIYLDGAKNQAKAPNENFARELLELFTLGEGHYTEADVQQAARALSGTTINMKTGDVIEPRFRHDRGDKTFLGKSGNLDKGDVVDVLLANPRTSEFIVEKLWREFVSPTPDPVEVKRLAALFRDGNYEVKPLLRALFLSDAFWAEKNRGTLVKSPIELVVGSARALELVNDGDGDPSPVFVARTARSLGQDLFDPPNVKGWPGGERWITAMTLPDRERLAREAAGASSLKNGGAVSLATLLLPLPAVDDDVTLDAIARDPAFQLK